MTNLQFPTIFLILADKDSVFLGYNYCLLIKQINYMIVGKKIVAFGVKITTIKERILGFLYALLNLVLITEKQHSPGFGQLLKT